jgi:hypothetical protein
MEISHYIGSGMQTRESKSVHPSWTTSLCSPTIQCRLILEIEWMRTHDVPTSGLLMWHMGATEAKYATKLEYLVCFAQDTEHLWLSWTFLKGSAMGTLIS